MRPSTRHPRLAGAACRAYSAVIRSYPPEFRREFGHELAITFRSRVEDVLDGGGLCDWLSFAAHIAVDSITARGTILETPRARSAVSVLGLSDDETVQGCVTWSQADAQLTFRLAGFVLSCTVCYAFFTLLFKNVH